MIRECWYRIGKAVAAWAPRAACAALMVGASGMAVAQEAATEYANLMADVDRSQQYISHLEDLLQSQQEDIASFTAQIASLEPTAAAVQPLIQKMFVNLEQFVANDLPFLPEERAARMDTLRLLMGEENKISEKFRRLLEAYQIEIEYGRTMDAYPGTLADGREVQFIHLGRVSLMYRTTDGTETAYWDAEAGNWVVDKNIARGVSDAIEMAEEAVAPDLVTLPVPAASEETQS